MPQTCLARTCARRPRWTGASASTGNEKPCPVQSRTWEWGQYTIRYTCSGSDNTGPSLVLVHGFGANAGHWRKNTGELASAHNYRVYAIDLLGYGYSSKPDPGEKPATLYNFYTWANQVGQFIEEVVGDQAYVVCNSIGGIVGLQCAIDFPEKVRGVFLLNVSLRGLHYKNVGRNVRPFIESFQMLLWKTHLGDLFFSIVAREQSVRSVLRQAYCDPAAVTDELVQLILQPGLQPGAKRVFLDFVCYNSGPLPGELLETVERPVAMAWGEDDPWEDINKGRELGQLQSVEEFTALESTGHCPQDEKPGAVNALIHKFIQRRHQGAESSSVPGDVEEGAERGSP